MREIADEVGAMFMVDMAHFAGLVAGKVLTGDYDPVPHAHIVTTTTHKTLRGPRGGLVLCDDDLAEFVDRGCPLVLGGPLPHVMAAKAVALRRGVQPSFQHLRRAPWSTTHGCSPKRWSPVGCRWSPAAPTTTSCFSTSAAVRAQRTASRGRASGGRHHA